jgi:CDP-ribitol ribitolphosphotransferase
VDSITWERVQLTFVLVFDDVAPEPEESRDEPIGEHEAIRSGDVRFILVDKGRELPVEAEHLGGNRYRIRINITQFVNRRQIPDGTWRFIALIGGNGAEVDEDEEIDEIAETDGVDAPGGGDEDQLEGPEEDEEPKEPEAATYSLEDVADLDDRSRVFLYDGNKTAFTVSFGYTEADDPPVLLMRTYQMFRGKGGKKPRGLKRLKALPKKVTSRKTKTKVLTKYYNAVRRLYPPDGTRILFASEQRQELGGNLLRIRDRMVERGLDTDFEFSYSFRVPTRESSNKQSTLRAVYLLARADYVFIDDFFALLDSVKLDPSTILTQVWHAGSGFKAVGYSRFGKYGSPKLQNAHRKYTYAITGSTHLVPVYAEVFGIEESAVVPTGLPRIDTFIDPVRTEQVTEDIYRQYPDLRDKKLILFAPTFRGRGIRDAYYPYDKIDFDALYEYCGEDTVVLFRMHHFVDEPTPIPEEYRDRMRDFSHFPNGNDLLHVVDLMITDYSSIIYEYSLLNRPMLFFAYDKDVYAATRGFHRDYIDTAPGKVVTTFDDLLTAMRDEDFEQWRRDQFLRENFDHVDTHSADRVIDWLILGKPIGTPVEGQADEDPVEASIEAAEQVTEAAEVAAAEAATAEAASAEAAADEDVEEPKLPDGQA